MSPVMYPTGPRYPGQPLPSSHPDHQPRVPTAAGVPPYCSCGYVGGNGTDRPLLAAHIAEHEAQLGAES